ncbi:type VI secretion system Vgr family protein [Pantoea trifolii]|uniref:Type VI secretion system tip protein VgrG n=1 Tax=Pantoea trifolii TaxID=2968030 RepID=A0ABT1VKQ2_9GAMM|nr:MULTISPECIES: type VI secretion system Vgr family protein [unclassified Pantoea]MCQ8228110.1 type VI secretion system tip protein VgrG [Pantoea sp. MMK2]MCQ8236283.1 type VI secretion system tip protein VgrG [Pantoea sp. MMK3]
MNMTDLLQGASSLINGTLNRYQLSIPSCSSSIDVENFNGAEALSENYRYDVLFTSPDKDITAAQMLRKPATLTMGTGELMGLSGQKMVHGYITDFHRLTGSADQVTYLIVIEPRLALLDKQYRSHRFFVNKSVPEVVSQILDEHGFQGWEYEFSLKHEYPRREQINQYQESDLQFIRRLLSEVGIFYMFTLQPDTQTEVVRFGDAQSALIQGKPLPLNSPSGLEDNGQESIWGLNIIHKVVEAGVVAKDYNHREAQRILRSVQADMSRGDGDEINYGQVYHYRPRHPDSGDKYVPAPETANYYARLDHERFLCGQTLITGISNDASLAPGKVLTIIDGVLPTLPEQLQSPVVVTRIHLSASRKSALQINLNGVPYSETLCWRPRLLPRPKVSGTMTARVTSAKDNDIYAWQDASGLYRVVFDADEESKDRGQESMPVRLAKPYGGDMYGFHFPLIQGTEVAIAFREGDPDQPYIAHALHDSRHVDHVTEKNSTRNVIRTAGLNKLRMEDKRGEEHIKLSTEYGGKTQLNLGHNVDASRTLRGEGAELRSDKHVSIRGGSGIFITADCQSSASGMMLEMQAAISQLHQAQLLTESLRGAAETAKAELADLQTQKMLLKDSIEELKQAALLLSAPAGIAASTPKSIQLSAGENLMLTGGKNTDLSVMEKFTVAAGEAVSLFAQKLGIKIFAAKGKVELQAQDDEMTLDALKDVNVSSSQGKIVIRAEQDILLVGSGGAYLRIGNGEVESGAPDKIIQRAAVWQKFGGQSASEMFNTWQQGNYEVNSQLIRAGTEEAVKSVQGNINSGLGKNIATSDGAGNVTPQNFPDIASAKLNLNKER